ncbi:sodium:solute symporter family transporter [Nonomuraea africana]|uniref:Cation/acetate symporter n=1 Tax=Nonomuraea africana TaxID=46171 RepID=A0ABR9KHP9_9ACTN|nr:cation acetate symporter [Nonomuraea africana]MBE1561547.1 cation/acetate symporter [Nonomuraea africana]
MNAAVGASAAGIAFVIILAVLVGTVRPRRYATVAEFYVAARVVRPWWNGAAISSEFTSAAVCLGLAGLIATHGASMLWYPAGAAAGYVVILALVVAPLRRSGTYTLPDFAQWRLGSTALRRFATCHVLVIGLLYLVAQLHAAGLVIHLLTGLPHGAGWLMVALVSVVVALAGGMGSVTSVQAVQYWLKLIVFTGVGVVLWCAWRCGGVTGPPEVAGFAVPAAAESIAGAGDTSLPGVLTVLLACALGTMGLPHIIVRVYTNPDGRSARRSIVATQVLLGLFFLLLPLYGILGRVHVPGAHEDEIVLMLPGKMLPGLAGDVLTGLLAAGAFAAFLATSCGVLAAVGGAVSACVTRPSVGAFRVAVAMIMGAALTLTSLTTPGSSVLLVILGFSLSAATFCPLLLLGIWWRRLTAPGVAAGFAVGGGLTVVLVAGDLVGVYLGVVSRYPAPFAVPLSFAVMMLISLVTPGRVPLGVDRMMAVMHLPEDLAGPSEDRSSLGDGRSSS